MGGKEVVSQNGHVESESDLVSTARSIFLSVMRTQKVQSPVYEYTTWKGG